LARETHLEALEAAMYAGDLGRPGGVREAAEAARAAPPGPGPPRAVDVLLDAFALRFTEGHAAAAAALTRALELLVILDAGASEARRWIWLADGRARGIIAMELWDFGSWHALAARQVLWGSRTRPLWLTWVFYAARSYSLRRPPRTGRRLTRTWERSATG
jgi:hypothetical protein